MRSLPKPESITWMKDGLPLDHESFDRFVMSLCGAENLYECYIRSPLIEVSYIIQFEEVHNDKKYRKIAIIPCVIGRFSV